ncbi:hypothetical protein EDD15DRAFT_2249739 [Pisolithus albus]|nr:hypothetical protein EDD15DRAFT_2249739 [Pisolithus albus]
MTTSQWGFSKSFDNTTLLGPLMPLTSNLNGKNLQTGIPSRGHIFDVRKTVAFLSQATTLEPGSVVLTGTLAGVGYVRKPPVVLRKGNVVRVWPGHGIGTLVNPVVEEGVTRAKL